MSEREFKSATEAVEFYREQVRTQNGYAMQQRLRAEEAEAERDRLRTVLIAYGLDPDTGRYFAGTSDE